MVVRLADQAQRFIPLTTRSTTPGLGGRSDLALDLGYRPSRHRVSRIAEVFSNVRKDDTIR